MNKSTITSVNIDPKTQAEAEIIAKTEEVTIKDKSVPSNSPKTPNAQREELVNRLSKEFGAMSYG